MKNFLITLIFFLAFVTVGFTAQNDYFTQQDSSMVYDFPEKMAQFPGGADAMEAFIRKNLNYPADLKAAGVQGKVYVQFVVEKDGTITNVSIRRGAHEVLDAEAVKVIEKMPNWIPGSVRGKKVRVQQTIPIVFSA